MQRIFHMVPPGLALFLRLDTVQTLARSHNNKAMHLNEYPI